jgi:hypothetical protein
MEAPDQEVAMAEKFTDDELAFLRHVRFGELPARVRPEDMVEETDTGGPVFEPDARLDETVKWFGSAGMA